MSFKFYIEVYGCQMNVYDSRRIVDSLNFFGFEQTFETSEADILIFYTCNIREKAVQKLISNIALFKSEKTKVIAVGGCVAQAEKEGIFKRARSVNLAFGPQTYHKLPTYITKIINGKEKRIIDLGFDQIEKFDYLQKRNQVSFSEFVTIQEGCDNFCTYCVVPYTRGREYSRPVKDIILEIKELVKNGAKEITLLGQNVNSYHGEAPYLTIGSSQKTWRLEQLLQEISEIDGIKRLRYTTSHPKDFTKELMEIHANHKFLVPFSHIPLQSGSDKILKLMNRNHTAQQYLQKLKDFREICPDIQFSSDFIVGFPQETDEDFEETLNIAEQANYTLSFAFKYSRRKNTPADKMENQVCEEIKEVRLKKLQKVLFKAQESFNRQLIGKTQEVLFEKFGKKENQYIGKNVYLQSIIVESANNLIGQFKNVLIESVGQNCVFGKLV